MSTERRPLRQRGLTLIELIMFIVIVSVAVVGILGVMSYTTGRSADPMIQKQALAIAESLLEEVELQPFTYCDPDDVNATTATVAAVAANGCAATVQGLGPSPNTETRYNADNPFDNVGDYHGFSMNGIQSLVGGTPIGGLENYNATVTITNEAIGPSGANVPAADSLRIDVRVTGPGGTDITLTGYRARYAPRAVP
ncbi:MAG: prepilin-type N-terminal cleavage/methylation domain-containing protein [Burkholderiaceae bacterium]|nr:prepilin-type N-terminal cleavage/methylation domain-containing protein [Burkholderiaceae bacterium]